MKVNHIKLILAIILLSSASKVFSQENERAEIPLKKNAISISILGATPALGVVYERVVSKKISAELGLGFVSVGAGMKFYPSGMKMNKLLMHTGFTVSVSPFFTGAEIGFEGEGFVAYIPIGISYFGKKSLNIAADIGPGTSYFTIENVVIYGNLKIGIRF